MEQRSVRVDPVAGLTRKVYYARRLRINRKFVTGRRLGRLGTKRALSWLNLSLDVFERAQFG